MKISGNLFFFVFLGITGNVTIDSNGDRLSDYSLLDMNPNTGVFEVCNFKSKLMVVHLVCYICFRIWLIF